MNSPENRKDIKEKINRRQFLMKTGIAGTLLSGIPLLYWSPLFQNEQPGQDYIGDREFRVFKGLVQAWTDSWPELGIDTVENKKDYFKNFNEVLKVVRADKRQELLLAIKLLSYPPACFFLTGHLSPWDNKELCLGILSKWQESQKSVPKKLYMAFSSLFAAPLYSDKRCWEIVGYPGPPEIDRRNS